MGEIRHGYVGGSSTGGRRSPTALLAFVRQRQRRFNLDGDLVMSSWPKETAKAIKANRDGAGQAPLKFE